MFGGGPAWVVRSVVVFEAVVVPWWWWWSTGGARKKGSADLGLRTEPAAGGVRRSIDQVSAGEPPMPAAHFLSTRAYVSSIFKFVISQDPSFN